MSLATLIPSRDNGVKRNVIEAVIIGIILTALSLLVATQAGWIEEINLLETFAVFTSYGSTYLCVMERRYNYIFGTISTAAYCVLFWQFGLFASAAVNAYLALALVYGWFRWKSDAKTIPVRHVELKWIPAYVVAVAIGYFGIVQITTAMGATLPLVDSIILIGTLFAQFLLDNKRIETWYVWMIVNVVAIYVYFTAGLFLAAFQYVAFLLNAAFGWWMWKKSMGRTEEKVEDEEDIPLVGLPLQGIAN